jgi:hypothetical protein
MAMIKKQSVLEKIISSNPGNWSALLDSAIYLRSISSRGSKEEFLRVSFICYGATVAKRESRNGSFQSPQAIRTRMENIEPLGALVHNYVEGVRATVLSLKDPADVKAQERVKEFVARHTALLDICAKEINQPPPRFDTAMSIAEQEIGTIPRAARRKVAESMRLNGQK